MRHSHIDQIWLALRLTYGLVAFLAGLDKFFNLLTNWQTYLILPCQSSARERTRSDALRWHRGNGRGYPHFDSLDANRRLSGFRMAAVDRVESVALGVLPRRSCSGRRYVGRRMDACPADGTSAARSGSRIEAGASPVCRVRGRRTRYENLQRILRIGIRRYCFLLAGLLTAQRDDRDEQLKGADAMIRDHAAAVVRDGRKYFSFRHLWK